MSIVDDTLLAVGQLTRHWRFTLACTVCLSLAIATTTGVFSIVHEVILKPLPFVAADRLVVLRSQNQRELRSDYQSSWRDFLDWQAQSKTLDLATYQLFDFDLPDEHGFQRLSGFFVSDSFFRVLQAKAFLGLSLDETEPDGNINKIMISSSLWQQRYEAKPEILGELIQVNSWQTWPDVGSRGYRLVGVLPHAMRCLPAHTLIRGGEVGPNEPLDFCAPLDIRYRSSRHRRDLEVIGRLREGRTLREAQAEIDLIAARLAAEFPDTNRHWSVKVIPLHQHVYGNIRPLLGGVFAGALVLLAIALGNVAHLMLVRFERRGSEFAVRSVAGATPMRLAQMAFIEISLLIFGASLMACVLTSSFIQFLNGIAPAEIPQLDPLRFDPRVIVGTAIVALGCAAIVAVIPIKRAAKLNLNQMLNASGRTATQSVRSTRMLRAFMLAGIAGSYVLLVAAGLIMVRMRQLASVDPGFASDNRLTMTISLPQAKFEWNHNSVFCNEVIRRIEDTPGIESVAAVMGFPTTKNDIESGLIVEGRPEIRRGDTPPPFIRVVTDDYFRTMGIPILQGRPFNATDGIGEIAGGRTALVSQSMAQCCWPSQNPLGKRFKTVLEANWLEVIGVVGDVRSHGVDRPIPIDIYFPEKLFPQAHITLIAHTQTDPLEMVSTVKQAVAAVDPDAYVSDVKSMEQVLAESQGLRRYFLVLFSALAIIGIAMATLGVFLTTTFSVSQRERELCIRVAYGATPGDIVTLVLRRELVLAAVGLLLGAISAALIFASLNLPWTEVHSFNTVFALIVPGCLGLAVLISSLIVAIKVAWRPSIQRS